MNNNASNPPHAELLIEADRIADRVKAIAAQIDALQQGNPLDVVSVMVGSLFFTADLLRNLQTPCRLFCISASSYGEKRTSQGAVRLTEGGLPDAFGPDILVVDDILDTGLTLGVLLDCLARKAPRSQVRVCVLLQKQRSRVRAVEADYVGFDIPDRYVVGYGLDDAGLYRGLPSIYAMGG